MKAASDITTHEPTDTREISLPGGCILCGGDLSVKISDGGAASLCLACRWISRPHMKREDGAVHVIHPAGLVA